MKDKLVTFETAKLAEEKGFKFEYIGETLVDIPTQSLLQKWLREKYNLHPHAVPHKDHAADANDPIVFRLVIYGRYAEGKEYKNYEECLEDALLKALKLIPNDKTM